MSLINDALKKAQRERSEGGMEATGPTPGSARTSTPGGKSLALIAGGALALVVVSVGTTIYLLNRPARTPAPQVAANPQPVAPAATPTPTPETPKAVVTETPPPAIATKPAIVETKPAAAPANPVATQVAAVPPPTTPAAPVAAATPAPATPEPQKRVESAAVPAPVAATPSPAPSDDRIHQFLDNLRVAGVRAAGNDSRVMMNDKVYRLNEIVDRNLSLRLIKVEANNLTFSDINGNMYVKFF